MQTVPGFAKGLSDGLPKFVAQEGVAGYVAQGPAQPRCAPLAGKGADAALALRVPCVSTPAASSRA